MKSKFLQAALIALCLATIGIASQKPSDNPAPEIGIAVGQKMPRFVAPDQSGKEISSDSLNGPNGTLLLFFRSADW